MMPLHEDCQLKQHKQKRRTLHEVKLLRVERRVVLRSGLSVVMLGASCLTSLFTHVLRLCSPRWLVRGATRGLDRTRRQAHPV